MTQTDKNPFAELETGSTTVKTSDKQELDFSFFAEPAAQPPQQTATPDNDFSFFDEPPQTPHVITPETPTDTGFSFDDEAVGSPNNATPPESATGDANQPFERPDKHKMVFTCLKCSATEQVELPEHSHPNLKISCSSCSSTISITLEANAKRATQKSREIYCSNCGHALDQHPHCLSCGQFCPNYYLVENPAEAARKARASRSNDFRQTLANLKSSLTWSRGASSAGSKAPQYSTVSAKAGASIALRSKTIRLLAISAVLVVCLGTAAFYYIRLQHEQRYIQNYVKAVYALHVGTDLIMSVLNKSANDWKTAQASGSPYVHRTDIDTETRSAKISSEVAKLMQQLQNKVPAKFEQANSKLLALQNELTALQKAAAAPPASVDQLSALISNSDTKIKQKKQDLKANLDDTLQKELETAKKKFRGFENF